MSTLSFASLGDGIDGGAAFDLADVEGGARATGTLVLMKRTEARTRGV